jgi:hypothetical protein
MPKILEKLKNIFTGKIIYRPKKKSSCEQETAKPEERSKEQK